MNARTKPKLEVLAVSNGAAPTLNSSELRVSPSPQGVGTTQAQAEPARAALSMRRPSEILGMAFDDSDMILGDRVIAEGAPTTILGPGGIGKTRLLLQLAVSQITGRPFIGMAQHGGPRRWIIFQAENSNRRLRADLAQLRAWVGLEAWKAVDECLLVHTLENDTDGELQLETRRSEIERLIQEHNADVVGFDPLNCFSLGDLNSDVDMRAITFALTMAAKKGNPRRAIVLVHHSLAGRAGVQKATGWDRGSFGRNSKVLSNWTRSQINIAPGSAESNERLVVACGKINDGEEFPAFAIRRNAAGIYEVDPSFDMEDWQGRVAGAKEKRNCSTEQLLAYLGEEELSRSALVKRIMDGRGCGKTTAYDAVEQAEKEKRIHESKINKLISRTHAKR